MKTKMMKKCEIEYLRDKCILGTFYIDKEKIPSERDRALLRKGMHYALGKVLGIKEATQ
jgi:hypothetical protein